MCDKKKLKIAFLLDVFPCVSETFILNQIIDLIDKGHYVEIFANIKDETLIHEKFFEYQLNLKTNYHEVPPRKFSKFVSALAILLSSFETFKILIKSLNIFNYGLSALRLNTFFKYARFANKPSFDIVHSHFGHMGNYALELKALGFFKKSKLITTFHGHDINPKYLNEYKCVYKNLFENGDAFTVNSIFTRNLLLRCDCPNEKITKLPVALDTNLYKRTPLIKDKNFKIKIVFCGRFVAFKAPESVVEIAKYLIKDMGVKNVVFHMIGDGPLRRVTEDKVNNYGLKEYFSFEGVKTQLEIIQLLSAMDIFLYPSIEDHVTGRIENQGLVLQEAQALELPVITSNIGGIPEGIIDQKTGFIIKKYHPASFADKIIELMNNAEQRKKMGAAGRLYVKENFDSSIIGDQLYGLYKSLLNYE